jgi:hypothetical protein
VCHGARSVLALCATRTDPFWPCVPQGQNDSEYLALWHPWLRAKQRGRLRAEAFGLGVAIEERLRRRLEGGYLEARALPALFQR